MVNKPGFGLGGALIWLLAASLTVAQPAAPTANNGREFIALRQLIKAETPSAADLSSRGATLRGKAVHLYGRIVGRTTSPQGKGNPAVTIMLQTPGVTGAVMVATAEDSTLLCVDQVVHVLAECPADAKPSDPFRARSLIAEEDLPAEERCYQKELAAAQGGLAVKTPEVGGNGQKAVGSKVDLSKGGETAGPPASAAAETKVARPGTQLPERLQGNAGATVGAWKQWVSKINSRLSEAELELIVRSVLYYSALNGVDHRLSFAMIKCESSFNPRCVSHAGATGLTQLMPGTARGLGVDPWNIEQNISGGIRYLANQLRAYEGRPNYEQFSLGLASYNAGPNAVKRAGGVPNYPETIRYIKKVGDLFYQLYKAGMP